LTTHPRSVLGVSLPRLQSGAASAQRQYVSTEVNTVFQNLVGMIDKIDVAKLNAVLTAFADGVRGQGERIGEATTDANQWLPALNPRSDTIRADWRSFKGFSDAYSSAAQDILSVLNAGSTASATITDTPACSSAPSGGWTTAPTPRSATSLV
jgi:phospholipid/cholesterol/gamma-HCH transport system substrate-binding protein